MQAPVSIVLLCRSILTRQCIELKLGDKTGNKGRFWHKGGHLEIANPYAHLGARVPRPSGDFFFFLPFFSVSFLSSSSSFFFFLTKAVPGDHSRVENLSGGVAHGLNVPCRKGYLFRSWVIHWINRHLASGEPTGIDLSCWEWQLYIWTVLRRGKLSAQQESGHVVRSTALRL